MKWLVVTAPNVDRDGSDGDDDLLAAPHPPAPDAVHDLRPLPLPPAHLLPRWQDEHLETAAGVQTQEHSGQDTSSKQPQCSQCTYIFTNRADINAKMIMDTSCC